MNKISSWNDFRKHYLEISELGLSIDTSLINEPQELTASGKQLFVSAFQKMQELEEGHISNPDENCMVGHYWLRDPALSPSPKIKNLITSTVKKIQDFALEIHQKKLRPQNTDSFKNVLLLGIGGSALASQLLQSALSSEMDAMQFYFIDNTDPDGIDHVMSKLGDKIESTLTLVISKSGETRETRNAMLEVRQFYQKFSIDFSRHAVAITCAKSPLDRLAERENWLERFPMWDWIGGRTSFFSAVGMLPAALQGIDIKKILNGAKIMDEITRQKDIKKNPAAKLAWIWHLVGAGMGNKSMVILPYKDRLIFFTRYIQQLVMESIGKEKNLEGKKVQQGLTVFGNKGSTDQHSFLQQLRDGPTNFFVTFIEVLKERENTRIEVEPGITSGDYLQGFLLGTSSALFQNGRPSLTLTLDEIDSKSLGALIALFERTVGLYAFLIGINAYHQPGVELGKIEAADIIELSTKIQSLLKSYPKKQFSADAIANIFESKTKTVTIFKILNHLSANGRIQKIISIDPFTSQFKAYP